MTQRSFEIEKRRLDGGWVEVRLVYEATPADAPDVHITGLDARVPIAQFALTFAASFAQTVGASIIARELLRISDFIVAHSNGQCSKCNGNPFPTRH